MVKSALDLLENKTYKKGLLTGMVLAHNLKTKKKMHGGKAPVGLKKALAVLAGPLGWVWLAKNSNKEEVKDLKKRLEKYEPPPPPPKKLQPPPPIRTDVDDYDMPDNGNDYYTEDEEGYDDYEDYE